jgi:hypothetical protein
MKVSRILGMILIYTLLAVCARRRAPYEPEQRAGIDIDSSGWLTWGDTAVSNVKMPQQDIPWPSLADSPWPMAEANPQGLARTSYLGPENGRVVWTDKYELGPVKSGIAIGPDGSIYCVMFDCFAAFTPEGEFKWKITGERIYPRSGPVVAADSTIYGGFYGFRAIRPDGTIKWEILTDEPFSMQRPLIGIDGTLYVMNTRRGHVMAINPQGVILWEANTGFGEGYIVASPDGAVVYSPGENNTLVAMNAASGVELFRLSTGIPLIRGPAVDNQGNIYFPGADSTGRHFVFSYSSDNQLRWQFPIRGDRNSPGNYSGINLDHNGYVYTEWYGAGFFAFDYAGQFRWRLNPGGGGTDSPQIIDGTDKIYVMMRSSPYLHCMDPDGSILYSLSILDFPHASLSAGSISFNRTMVLGTSDYTSIAVVE